MYVHDCSLRPQLCLVRSTCTKMSSASPWQDQPVSPLSSTGQPVWTWLNAEGFHLSTSDGVTLLSRSRSLVIVAFHFLHAKFQQQRLETWINCKTSQLQVNMLDVRLLGLSSSWCVDVLLTRKLSEAQTNNATCGHANIMPTSHVKLHEVSCSNLFCIPRSKTLRKACVESRTLPNRFETIERLLRLSTSRIYARWFVLLIQKKMKKKLLSKIITHHIIW